MCALASSSDISMLLFYHLLTQTPPYCHQKCSPSPPLLLTAQRGTRGPEHKASTWELFHWVTVCWKHTLHCHGFKHLTPLQIVISFPAGYQRTRLMPYIFNLVWHEFMLIPCNIKYFQISKSDIKHFTLNIWNILKSLVQEYWTLSLRIIF